MRLLLPLSVLSRGALATLSVLDDGVRFGWRVCSSVYPAAERKASKSSASPSWKIYSGTGSVSSRRVYKSSIVQRRQVAASSPKREMSSCSESGVHRSWATSLKIPSTHPSLGWYHCLFHSSKSGDSWCG